LKHCCFVVSSYTLPYLLQDEVNFVKQGDFRNYHSLPILIYCLNYSYTTRTF